MDQETQWETDWDPNRPRWVYCLSSSIALVKHAEKKCWKFSGSITYIAIDTLERLEKESGLKLTGLELLTCYDRDIEKIIPAIILWKDSVPEPDEYRKEVGKMVDYLKEQIGLDPDLEPKWCLLNYLYELQGGGIDDHEKPESLIKFT